VAKDPYEDISDEELQATGATDWFSDTLAEQQKRNAQLKSALGQDTGSVRAKKQQLKKLLDLPARQNPEEPAPDLFAAERTAAQKKRSALSSIVDELEQSRAAEKELLKDLFGK
jgi:hypothetical protein